MAKIRVAVIFGGVSSEHAVSLLSAASVIRNLSTDDFEIICIGITEKGRWLYYPGDVSLIENGEWERHPDAIPAFISPDRATHGIVKTLPDGTFTTQKIDVAFPVLHGRNGEDGTIQGLFALAGIPFVGCDLISSAVCMDKAVTNTMLDHYGIAQAPWTVITHATLDSFEEIAGRCERDFGYPMFVKPANAGSSVGITKAHNREELRNGVRLAMTHDPKVVIEKGIVGKELECAVMGNSELFASVVSEILPCNEFYDYEAKYIEGSVTELPANISDELSDELRATAVKVYSLLGCGGLARVDFLYEEATNTLMLNELNTLPGFTAISMYPQMMNKSGYSYPELLKKLIMLAIERSEG